MKSIPHYVSLQFRHVKQNQGFTLIEISIALLISTILMGSLYSAYITQQHSQTTQQQVVDMQQNLRAVMTQLSSEIRLAGYKPPSSTESPGITATSKGRIRFTWETDANTNAMGPDMNVAYRIASSADTSPTDGIADNGSTSLHKIINANPVPQPIADNIAALEFLYTFEDTSDNGIYDPKTTLTPAASELQDIRAVTISVLARSSHEDRDFKNTATYSSASGHTWGPFNDGYRRRLLISTVKLRNMGL